MHNAATSQSATFENSGGKARLFMQQHNEIMLKLKQQMHWWRSTENWHPITQSTHTQENTSSTGAGITVSEASYHFPRKEVMLPMCHRCPPPCKVSCLSTTTRHMSEATSTQVHTTIWQLKDLKATERFMCQSTVMLNAHRSSTAEHVFVVRQHRSSTA